MIRSEEGKTALIFGVTGQDGSFLAEMLLSLGCCVHGVKRRTSASNLTRLSGIVDNPKFNLHIGDVTDFSSVSKLIMRHKPDYVYNLAAQSHVGTSFDEPFASIDITLKGSLNILECIRLFHPCKMYQASSSEMFGNSFSEREIPFTYWDNGYGQKTTKMIIPSPKEIYQDEQTKMLPCSPYAVAKLAAHNLIRSYRLGYNIWACGGILFNHESERRGEEFVTRKITKYIAQLYNYLSGYSNSCHPGALRLGNIDSERDWGYAPDYVRAMIMMMQATNPEDYVVATGETYTIRQFIEQAFQVVDITDPFKYVELDTTLIRPCDVVYLRGDASKIRRELGWTPSVSFEQLVQKMVTEDVKKCLIET